jgi:DNA-binding NtrC family response regulator/tetratricopeptide (TPR) repeat protein
MQDPKRFEACFQGARNPREGERHESVPEETGLGDLCLSVGNVTDALAYYKSALTKVKGDDIRTRLEIVLKTSRCLRQQGKADEALAFVQTVLDSFTDRHRRDVLAEKANLLCLLGHYGDAALVCEEAQALEVDTDRAEDAGLYLVLGHVLSRLCEWRKALVCLDQAATFSRMCGDLRTLGNALNNLGIVNKNLCQLEDSAKSLAEAVQVARRTHDQASLAVRLLNLANTLYKGGDIMKADEAISECIRISTALNIGRTNRLASICKARIEKVKGNMKNARRMLEAAIAELEQLDDPRALLVAKETLGEVLMEDGDLVGARDLLEAGLGEIPPQARDIEAEIRSRLSEVYLGLGRRPLALEHARQAANIAEETGDLYEVGRAYRILALATAPGDGSEAYMERAEAVFSRMKAELELGLTRYTKSRIGGCPAALALTHLKQAILAFRKCAARRAHLQALCDLSVAYAEIGRHEQAVSCLDEAKAMSGGRTDEKETISNARSRVDGCISQMLSRDHTGESTSIDAAFSHLASRLRPACMILAALGDGMRAQWGRHGGAADTGIRIVKAHGINDQHARDLVRQVIRGQPIGSTPGPLILTDLSTLECGPQAERFRMLLGYRLPRNGSDGLFIACWECNPDRGHPMGPGVSLLVRACCEFDRLAGVLARTVGPAASTLKPICLGGMLTADETLKSVLLSLRRIADASANVLITGETGTGKELVARAIHAFSRRKEHPFVAQNCAALPEHLLESELFGHKAGAFTGARRDKKGLLEVADGGVFLLDEVGDVGLAIQAKLLRAIETGEIRYVGDTATRRVDVRFLSATNKNLEAEVEQGRFRRDLFYRLNVVSVHLPPLRDRDCDVEILSRLFLKRFAARMAKPIKGIDAAALRALVGYDWPGNVRQLENEMEKAVTLAERGGLITLDVLSPCITGSAGGASRPSLREELRAIERRRILAALRRCEWNKTHAARLLGDLSRPALIAKMKRLGIPLRPG